MKKEVNKATIVDLTNKISNKLRNHELYANYQSETSHHDRIRDLELMMLSQEVNYTKLVSHCRLDNELQHLSDAAIHLELLQFIDNILINDIRNSVDIRQDVPTLIMKMRQDPEEFLFYALIHDMLIQDSPIHVGDFSFLAIDDLNSSETEFIGNIQSRFKHPKYPHAVIRMKALGHPTDYWVGEEKVNIVLALFKLQTILGSNGRRAPHFSIDSRIMQRFIWTMSENYGSPGTAYFGSRTPYVLSQSHCRSFEGKGYLDWYNYLIKYHKDYRRNIKIGLLQFNDALSEPEHPLSTIKLASTLESLILEEHEGKKGYTLGLRVAILNNPQNPQKETFRVVKQLYEKRSQWLHESKYPEPWEINDHRRLLHSIGHVFKFLLQSGTRFSTKNDVIRYIDECILK